MDYDRLQTTLLPIAREYYLARRRYAAAMKRGDLKSAQAWLDIAEREMALTERHERTELRRSAYEERSKFRFPKPPG